MKRKKPMDGLDFQLRRAFEATGWSVLELSRRAETPYAPTHRVMCGMKDCKLSTATRLAAALKLRLVREDSKK